MRLFDRAAPGGRVDAAALEPRGEGLADGEIIALVGTGALAARTRDVRAPDQRHVAARRQGAAAFERDDALQRILASLRTVGQPVRQTGVAEKIGQPPLARAERAEQPGRDVGGEQVDGNALADAVDRAIGVGRHRLACRRHVGGDQEDLILLDLLAIGIGQDRACDGAARVDGKGGTPRHRIARDATRGGDAGERAFGATGERGGEVEHPGLLIDPAALPGAWRRQRRGAARVAERDHGLAEPDGEALYRAAADAGLREYDAGRVVAERRDRRRRQRQHRHSPSTAHRPVSPNPYQATLRRYINLA